jgi:UDP-N-acetylglucosamine 3-dehydrogenase
MGDLRLGLIGLGMMGRHHARVIRETEGVTLVAVADSYGDPHGVAGDLDVSASVDELIARGIDGAVATSSASIPPF